ncbi:MAG TPA: MFS transporter [Gemmatimonadaceae bacterium]|jgi:UMF1 family MFS transporter|nr:MFS transporter [Gemmatimonadaceae bacterium]
MAHPQHAMPLVVADGEIRAVARAPARERVSWALYDFSNTIFSMNIATLYFAVWLVDDLGVSNTMDAAASAVASVLVVIAIPFLGALSDVRRRRKPWVVGFTLLSCVGCALMGIFGQTLLPLRGEGVDAPATVAVGWHASGAPLFWVLAAYVMANFAYQAAQPFYNAMLPDLAPPEEQGRLSGFGTAVGYVGSIVGVMLVKPFFNGDLPGIGKLSGRTMSALHAIMPYTSHGGRVSAFLPTGVLFLLFSLPLFLFCRDHNPAPRGTAVDWRRAVREVIHTIRDARRHPGTLRFIIASFVYQDAIGTIVGFMTLYAVKAVGFEKGAEVTLFMVLTIPSIFGSYIYGHLVDRFGARRSLMTTLLLWIVLLALMIVAPGKQAFWLVGLAIGLNFGGVPTAERPVLLSLVPGAEAGRYFSLMLLSSRAAAIAGPLIWGVTVDSLESRFGTFIAYRAAVMTVAVMFVIAALILRGVPDRLPREA